MFAFVRIGDGGDFGVVKHFGPSSGLMAPVSGRCYFKLWILCNMYFAFVFIMLSCLFLAAMLSPAWKGLTSLLSCV